MSTGVLNLVPTLAVEAYRCLYCLEVGLREFVIDSLSESFGARWWRTQLPPDVSKVAVERASKERTLPWISALDVHPIYFVEFPDLRKLIDRNDNWEASFARTLVRRDVFGVSIATVEPVRNKVAHCRTVSEQDAALLLSTLQMFAHAIGEDRFDGLVARGSTDCRVSQRLIALRSELDVCTKAIAVFGQIDQTPEWQDAETAWWFNSDYLGAAIDPIAHAYSLVHSYMKLPTGRGSGLARERLANAQDAPSVLSRGRRQLTLLIKEARPDGD